MNFVGEKECSYTPLDLVLRCLINSKEFNEITKKNWDAVKNLIPGTTTKQIERRYEELLRQKTVVTPSDIISLNNKVLPYLKLPKSDGDSEHLETKTLSRPGSGKPKAVKNQETEVQGKKLEHLKGDQGPIMVIHVCDEAKNLKHDFHCPRDLLVHEMRYFAEYLSTDAHRWEEVDISVHCDVKIFDWLMKYVKRHSSLVTVPEDTVDNAKLEPNNVISILISSDFLKMDSLVQRCIEYCHKNMNGIVNTPCNMNCINDKLVTRIADLFTHNEIDDLKDRKDKFKSKLFSKKIEKLFDTEANNLCSPENAVSLFRCSVCGKLLTSKLENTLPCAPSRMVINYKGETSYRHVRDMSWDVNDWLVELKRDLKMWREVYWQVWGTINYLECARCHETFQCCNLGHCCFHPDEPIFEPGSSQGTYPCCALKTNRFDPVQPRMGCRTKDHIVTETQRSDGPSKQRVYDDLLLHRDVICKPYTKSDKNESQDINIFANEECLFGHDDGGKLSSQEPTHQPESSKSDSRPVPRLQPLMIEREVSFEEEQGLGESDDEVGDDEPAKVRSRILRRSKVTVAPQAILLDAPDFHVPKSHRWDGNRSLRWNQDAQREEDLRRIRGIGSYLTKLRLNNDKLEKWKQKEYSGGIFAKLDAQWKNSYLTKNSINIGQLRSKGRQNQIRGTLM